MSKSRDIADSDITAHPNFPNLNGADWPATPE